MALNIRRGGKYNVDYGIMDVHTLFEKRVGKNTGITTRICSDVCRDFNKQVWDKILLESKEIKIPLLGRFRIYKWKPKATVEKPMKGYATDYKASREAGKWVCHVNDHRDGYRYRVKWTRKYNLIKGMSKYYFIALRTNQRRLAKILKENMNIDYFE